MQTSKLVRAAQAGDADSRETLARTWLPLVYGAALARTRHRAAAEDLTQEAFCRAFASLGTLRDPSRFGPWLLRIVRNAARDLARRERLRTTVAAFEPPAGEDPPSGEHPVVDAWRALPEDERLVCWLHVVHDLPLRQIASLLSVSKSAAGRRARRGLARMRRELQHVVP